MFLARNMNFFLPGIWKYIQNLSGALQVLFSARSFSEDIKLLAATFKNNVVT